MQKQAGPKCAHKCLQYISSNENIKIRRKFMFVKPKRDVYQNISKNFNTICCIKS